ncbi:ANK_REP_REGION domain-containing protein [Haematococcus lacustris]|uniref:ANK_REP_REGION domain-containing protein n=1 Tax=Haematococcus lacustris TaxID=44745 RepID=A0A699ZGB6_HAELA|nr:ANK_REP_REGION domain-containing protein [Haematococcus lacustris]
MYPKPLVGPGTSAGPHLNYYPPIPSAESAPFSPTPQAAAAANPSSPASSVAATASNLASSLYKAFFPPLASPAAPAGSPGPSGPPAGPTPQTQPSLAYADLPAPPGKLVEPSAPTLTDEDDDSQPACVICWSAPREVGLLHGSSVHKCVCRECAAGMKAGITPCPLCRQTVERVLNVFE